MSNPNTDWRVFPHEPIQKLEHNLWHVRGAMPNMTFSRCMSVARLEDGRLVIHNAVALNEDAMREIEAWGTPAFVIVPNAFHRIDVARFKHRYPDIQVICPRAADQKVRERVTPDLFMDAFAETQTVAMNHLGGVAEREGFVRVQHDDGTHTLVLNDSMFNMKHQPGFKGFVVKMLGSSGGPKVSRIFRTFMMKDKQAFRQQLEALAVPSLKRVIVAHEDLIETAPADTLRAVASTL